MPPTIPIPSRQSFAITSRIGVFVDLLILSNIGILKIEVGKAFGFRVSLLKQAAVASAFRGRILRATTF